MSKYTMPDDNQPQNNGQAASLYSVLVVVAVMRLNIWYNKGLEV